MQHHAAAFVSSWQDVTRTGRVGGERENLLLLGEAPGRKLGEREFTEIGSKMHMGDLRGFFEVRNYSPEGASEAVMFHHNDATFALQAAFDLFFALGDALLLHFM